MIICKEEYREALEVSNQANPFPDAEPFDDVKVVADGWVFGSTCGWVPFEDLVGDLNRMTGRSDYEDILLTYSDVKDSPPPRGGEMLRFFVIKVAEFAGLKYATVGFFVHPDKMTSLQNFTDRMFFMTVEKNKVLH